MKKAILGILVAAVVVLAGAYLGSPYWAVRQMQAAARAGGGEPLNRYVDYPAVRRGVMTQMQAMVQEQRRADDKSSITAMMSSGTATMLLEIVATPDGVANLIATGKPKQGKASTATESPAKPPVDLDKALRIEQSYESLDVFRVDMRDANTDAPLPSLVLHREGWFGWKLREVRLDALKRK